jgi:DNA-binding transcriptional regulator YhcF (GntR family)
MLSGLSPENEEKLCQLISEARISGMSREDFVKIVDKYFTDRRE